MLTSLKLSLQVIKSFTTEQPTWGIRELGRELGESHTKIFRILETMKKEGFAVQNPETKKYSLGIPFISLGEMVKKNLNIEEEIRPLLIEMRDQAEESIYLTVIDQYQGRTLLGVDSKQGVKSTAFEGSLEPLHAGASYRAILAYQSAAFIDEVLKTATIRYTENTILRREEQERALEEVVGKGYAISFGEYTPDVYAIAFPLRDASGEVRASLTISGPIYRMTEEKISQFIELGKKGKLQLERFFKYSGIYIN